MAACLYPHPGRELWVQLRPKTAVVWHLSEAAHWGRWGSDLQLQSRRLWLALRRLLLQRTWCTSAVSSATKPGRYLVLLFQPSPFSTPPAPTNGRITSGVCTGLPDTEARRRWCSGDAATSTFFSALCRGHSAFVSSSSLPRIHPLNGPCPHRLCQDDRWLGQHERVEEGPPHRTPPCSSF